MTPKLPKGIDFNSPDRIAGANDALRNLVDENNLTSSQVGDGLMAAGVAPELVGSYAAAIVLDPEASKHFLVAPFLTGFAFGVEIVASKQGVANA